MVYKKYLLLAGLSTALSLTASAQESGTQATATYASRDMTYRGESYDVLDSTLIPKSRLDQYRRFVNHQYAFPPKPNNMWEVGVSVGALNVFGDVTSKTPFTAEKFTNAAAFGITVRKAIGYVFSLRAQYIHGVASGFDFRKAVPNNAAWVGAPYTNIYQNYRTNIDELSLQLVASTNNISFHRGKNWFNFYGLVGLGLSMYDPKVDARVGNSTTGAFHDPTGSPTYAGANPSFDNRKETNDWVKDSYLDGDYETSIPRESSTFGSNKNITPVLTAGAGIQVKLSKRLSLQIEDKFTFTGREQYDATSLQNSGDISPDKDIYNYGSIGLGFNIGNKNKNIAPLWWVNPLDHIYNELADPRHMKLPDPILPDNDGDGIADQFDKCPGTPSGVAVDSHGCPMDTDGDGVPDDRDKQLITPTECQPVDADGVGKCPCPADCGTMTGACGNIGAGSLVFPAGSSKISSAMQAQLAQLAAQMQANPTCKAVVVGNGSGSKVQQQRSWDRVNAVIEYMSEKNGIDRGRFIFQYGGQGDANVVMYRSSNGGEEGPSNVAPPFPNLRRD